MGTRIKYRVLYGDSESGPVCSLLQINEFTALLDCGWDDDYRVALLKPVEEVLESIDAVLISHPDVSHLGALPYLVGKLKLQAPIYVTVPCHKMGQMFMYDQFLSRRQSAEFDVFTLDDVDAAFQLMRQVKYQQQVKLTGKGQGLSVTAFAAGHLVGGALWQVLTADEEQVVYAVHWNHANDRHLKRADLEARFSRPAVLITDACSALKEPVKVHERDTMFCSSVAKTLTEHGGTLPVEGITGNVLIPADTAGRVLELLLILEQYWLRNQLRFTIVLLTSVAYSTLEFAKSQLEWMNQDISDAFTRNKSNPFDFRHVKACHSKEKVWDLPAGPKVVLASMPSLATGSSLQLLVDWAPNPNNLILFPSTNLEGGIVGRLQEKARGSKEAVQVQTLLGRRVQVEGEELKAWQEQQAAQLLQAQPMLLDEAVDDIDMDDQPATTPNDPPSSGALAGRPSFISQQSSQLTSMEDVKPKMRDTLVEGFTSPEGATAAMFPCEEDERRERTEYGITLRPSDFRRVRGEELGAEVASEDEAADEIPSRVVSSEVVVNVRAAVQNFNFEGLSDQHSTFTLLTKVAPRHLIIAYGSQQARQSLWARCEASSEIGWEVHKPGVGTDVDVSSGSSSYRAALSDELLRQLQFRRMAGSRLAWIHARLHPLDDQVLQAQLVPDDNLTANIQQGSIFIGDVKLSSLKRALGEAGISADFRAGMLICQSQIVIKLRQSNGQLTLEGPLCQDYYTIRNVMYSQFHVC